MRKLKLQVQISVDGFISGQNGEMDWLCYPWTDDIQDYVNEITEPVDTILLGRKLAEGFIPHWQNVANNPQDPDYKGGLIFTATPKIVFTKTIRKSLWDNTAVANGELADEINKLKNQDGKDIIVYGGGTFVTSLINAGLIGEFHLFINPTVIGNGMTIFKGIDKNLNLKLKLVKQFDCGIALTCYELSK
ncbi:MAG: dihydrofolate reductase family protein [Chitinophagales bacterium]|nr:dihydrofolate reductase family protein [Bacteroidota bacterium]MCB9042706.1 dihydrofolate reductase family protein [Chitinophagales bacterium]